MAAAAAVCEQERPVSVAPAAAAAAEEVEHGPPSGTDSIPSPTKSGIYNCCKYYASLLTVVEFVEIFFGEDAKKQFQMVRPDRKKFKKEAKAALREAGTWVARRKQDRCGQEKDRKNKR